MSTKIEIVVDYSDGLKSITVDNIDMDNISYIAKLPIDKWNTPSGGRANWMGLIEEIKALVADDIAELVFDFRGSEEHKIAFRACFGEKIDGLDEGEFITRRLNDAQKAEHTGDYCEALDNYIGIADRCGQVGQYYQAADYAYSIYTGDRNCEQTGNVELLQTYCNLCDKAFTIVKATQDATLALEAANKANFIFSQSAFSCVVNINEYIDRFIELLEQAGNHGSNEAMRILFGLYKEGSYVEQSNENAFGWLLKLGETEENDVQLQIADYYFEGGFIEQNQHLAFVWYTKSAQNGNTIAARKLALCYENGYGCEESLKDAFYWYNVSAESGDAEAKFKKAIMLYYGQGTIENKSRAFSLFSDLSEQGSIEANYWCGYCLEQANKWDSAYNYYRIASTGEHSIATYKVGICLLNEYGCEKDEVAAYQHFIRSAESEYEPAFFMVAECKRNGIGCNPNIDEAKQWYHRSALEGNSEACNILGEIYEAEKEYDNAVTWYLSAGACSVPSPKAKCNLGRCYYYGIGVESDYEKAEVLLIEAINSDNQAIIAEAKYYLGIANEEGHNSKGIRLEKAFSLFIEASDCEFPVAKAQYKVANCYHNGLGVQQDEEKAWEYYYKASQNGHPDAQYIHAKAIIDTDIDQAIKMLTSSANQGHTEAQYDLGVYYRKKNNRMQAIKWLNKALDSNQGKVYYELAHCYDSSDKKYFENMEKAADAGYVDAFYELAKAFKDFFGKGSSLTSILATLMGVSKKDAMFACIKYFEKAANQDDSRAMYELGDIYERGIGTTVDKVRAIMWYSKAADLGDKKAKAKADSLKGGTK